MTGLFVFSEVIPDGDVVFIERNRSAGFYVGTTRRLWPPNTNAANVVKILA